MFSNYDPLVSDTACHLRAAYLVALLRKVRRQPISADENAYLQTCKLLTQTKDREYDAFGLITREVTNIKLLPQTEVERYLEANPAKKEMSNNARNATMADYKKRIASTTLLQLTESSMRSYPKASMDKLTSKIKTNSVEIPVLPLFLSAELMLSYAALNAIPLAVNIRRIKKREGVLTMDGIETLVYGYSAVDKRYHLGDWLHSRRMH